MLDQLIQQILQEVFCNRQDTDTVNEFLNDKLQERGLYAKYNNGTIRVYDEETDKEVIRFQVITQIREQPVP